MALSTDKESYSLGENILISGNVARSGAPLSQNLDLNITADGQVILKKQLQSDSSGNFSFSYHTSIVEPGNGWKIRVRTVDVNGNTGYAEKDLNFSSAKITDFLTLSLAKELKGLYFRDETMELEVKINSESNAQIEGANVTTVTPAGDILGLTETQPGTYAGSFIVSRDFPLGMHEMKINASKIDGNHVYGGSLVFDFNVEGIGLNIELLEPVRTSFQIGEDITFKARVTYPGNEPLISPDLNAIVNGKKIVMRAIDKGMYVGTYTITDDDAQGLSFSVAVDDSFGNVGNTTANVEVSGTSWLFYARKYFNLLIITAVVLAVAAVIMLINLNWRVRLQGLGRKERQTIEKIKGVQLQYFKEGSIDRKTYDAGMQKFEAELEDVKKELAALEKKVRTKK